MKDVKEMNHDELLAYCMQRKQSGASYREIGDIFERAGTPADKKKAIMDRLDELDRIQKETKKTDVQINKGKAGLKWLAIGVAIVMGGIFLFIASAESGGIFLFNIFIWIVGAILILRGILHILAAGMKK